MAGALKRMILRKLAHRRIRARLNSRYSEREMAHDHIVEAYSRANRLLVKATGGLPAGKRALALTGFKQDANERVYPTVTRQARKHRPDVLAHLSESALRELLRISRAQQAAYAHISKFNRRAHRHGVIDGANNHVPEHPQTLFYVLESKYFEGELKRRGLSVD